MPSAELKREALIRVPAIVEEAAMIIVPPPIASTDAKKSVTPSAKETKAQEGYFIGWMLSNSLIRKLGWLKVLGKLGA